MNKYLIFLFLYFTLFQQKIFAKEIYGNPRIIDGDTIEMNKYNEKKILIVNVASRCGYTSQYQELQKLHEILMKAYLYL